MSYAVVRIRGTVNVRSDIKDTMKMLRLNRANHCIIIPETKEYKGMLQKVKDYVTWGEIESDVLKELIKTRGRLIGNAPITDEIIKSNSDYNSIDEFSDAIVKGKAKYSDLKGVKPVLRLHPPRKGYEGIKRAFTVGGALGYRGKEINKLLRRMM